MENYKILVVEDDKDISDLVSQHLEGQGYYVKSARTAGAAFAELKEDLFDVIILDRMLPDAEGLSICESLRQSDSHSCVLFLTARDSQEDKIEGLEAGADDYLAKPFSISELSARVKAMLRRRLSSSASGATKIVFGPIMIDSEKMCVTYNEKDLGLTQIELKLLSFLARSPGRVFNREELLTEVWGYKFHGYEHTVNTHINRLRMKLEENPSEPRHVVTVWGQGYKFVP